MSQLTYDRLKEFINALQLCISSEIESHIVHGVDSLTIEFVQSPEKDGNWEAFHRMVGGSWDKSGLNYQIDRTGEVLSPTLTNFLMLTRLNEQNIRKLSKLDPQYRHLTDKIFGKQDNGIRTVEGLDQAAHAVFERLEEQKMPIRQLAESTGLTQVTLSKFKAGGDIRFSNFLRIAKALGFKVRLE